jgi:hypothetical protein
MSNWLKAQNRRAKAAEREAAQAEERAERASRRENLWNVPERARDEFLAMEDHFCPNTVLDFMLVMHPEPD